MRRRISITAMTSVALCLSACIHKGTHPDDPYESVNRKTDQFNQVFDKAILKPAATIYTTVLPQPVRSGINNVYNNINMIPTVANDVLQAEWRYALQDTWRFIVNSTMGVAGILDPAETMSLPLHSNDLGITFAKWGDKHSPYIVIPFMGPSTIRDGMGLMFNYTLLTPYPYLNAGLATGLVGLRYVDLRSQMLDTEKLMNEALDRYSFMRDAYLQHRQYLITGEQVQDSDNSALYVPEDEPQGKKHQAILPEEPENGTKSDFPITTSQNDATHRPPSA